MVRSKEGLSFLAGRPGRKKVSRAQELPVRTTLSRRQPRRHRARLFTLSLGFGADGQDVYERDSCCLGPPSGRRAEGPGASKTDLEGRLALHLPAGDFIKQAPDEWALPHCSLQLGHGHTTWVASLSPSPDFRNQLQVAPWGLGRHPPSNAEWRFVLERRAITSACQF